MSKLADPTVCPDCRTGLQPDGTCPGCGLRLAGPLAVDLWHTMLRADGIVERLRATSVGAPAVAHPGGAPTTPAAAAAGRPVGAVRPGTAPAGPSPRRLPSASVPVVLLGLGGLCLLVAAVVFVAVTWSSLGIGARTAILLGVTAVVAAAAAVVTRRGLRIAAETLWVVACGMLALDWLGAHSAGLLGLDRLDGRHVTGIVGVLVATAGLAAVLWSARRNMRLVAPQVVAVLGVLVTLVAEAWAGPHPALADTVAVPVLAALVWALRRAAPWTAAGVGVWTAVSWLAVAGSGVDRLSASSGDRAWWSTLEGWPLLAAAGLAIGAWLALTVPSVRSFVTPLARSIGADGLVDVLGSLVVGAALVCLSLLVIGPLDDPARDLVVGAGVVTGLGLLAVVTPPVWSRAAGALAGSGTLVLTGLLAVRPWQVLAEGTPADGQAPLLAPLAPFVGGLPPWATLPVGAAVLVAAWGALHALPSTWRVRVAPCLAAAGPAVAGLAVADVVLVANAPLWAGALALAVALAASVLATAWLQGDPAAELAGLVATALLLAPAARLSLASHLLEALLATLVTLVLLAGHRLLRPAFLWEVGPTLLAVLAVPSSALGVAAWMQVAGGSDRAVAFAVAGVAVAAGLGARFLARDRVGRDGMELVSLPVGLAAVAAAPTAASAGLVATVVGSAICLLAVLDSLVWVGWLGSAVLGAATLLRVAAGVSAPEVVTLPAAALLLGAGVWRLRRDPGVSSITALGSGLALALLPSLLLALDEPVSLRGALIGIASIAVLAAGVACRWAAPFLAGAATTAVLAVRHLWPVAEALPRWVAFGTVGLLLLLVGITWESRRRDLAAAARYVRALR